MSFIFINSHPIGMNRVCPKHYIFINLQLLRQTEACSNKMKILCKGTSCDSKLFFNLSVIVSNWFNSSTSALKDCGHVYIKVRDNFI